MAIEITDITIDITMPTILLNLSLLLSFIGMRVLLLNLLTRIGFYAYVDGVFKRYLISTSTGAIIINDNIMTTNLMPSDNLGEKLA